MRKFQHSACNDVLGAPPGMSIEECEAIAICRVDHPTTPTVTTFWKPEASELAALNEGRAVMITVLGRTMQPLRVEVAAEE